MTKAERKRPFGCEPKGRDAAKTERALTLSNPVDHGKQLVCIAHREAMTSSVTVAEVFHKRHDNVVRDIRKLIGDLPAGSLLRFEESSYLNEQNKSQPMYQMTRDGFSLLAMGFSGKKALEFKLKFLDAFNLMERDILNQSNLSWQQERTSGKAGRRIETDVIQRFVEYATCQGAKSASWYYASITMLTNSELFRVKAAGRDSLSALQLSFLTVAEQIIRQTLENGMSAGMHYKVIYQAARSKVFAFAAAAALPCQRRISA